MRAASGEKKPGSQLAVVSWQTKQRADDLHQPEALARKSGVKTQRRGGAATQRRPRTETQGSKDAMNKQGIGRGAAGRRCPEAGSRSGFWYSVVRVLRVWAGVGADFVPVGGNSPACGAENPASAAKFPASKDRSSGDGVKAKQPAAGFTLTRSTRGEREPFERRDAKQRAT